MTSKRAATASSVSLPSLCGAEAIEQEGGVVDIVIGGGGFVEHTQVTS
jgi:hypothetical protein